MNPEQATTSPAATSHPQSGLGTASLIISLLMFVVIFLVFGYAGYLETTTPGGMQEDSPVAALVGVAFLGCMMMFLIGLILGIIGLFQRERRKLTAILGVIFNGLFTLVAIGVILLGLSVS
ncbi:MAG: hypothetical protein KJO55_02640 [Gammaproteobacteria bacterium]|nr:hypothetical protein [Gammaproteobacteria bacterium]NND61416.1 hypothetical protein [Gammaproteobacteria bacterium]